VVNLVDRCAALRTALAGNHPYSVTTLKARRATASGYLRKSAYSSNKARPQSTERVPTGIVKIPSASNMHGTAILSIGACWHMAVSVEKSGGIGDFGETVACEGGVRIERVWRPISMDGAGR
jgi:hypothetical protein